MEWFVGYLRCQKQRVGEGGGGVKSEWTEVKRGVRLCSRSPTLYCVHANDLSQMIENIVQ